MEHQSDENSPKPGQVTPASPPQPTPKPQNTQPSEPSTETSSAESEPTPQPASSVGLGNATPDAQNPPASQPEQLGSTQVGSTPAALEPEPVQSSGSNLFSRPARVYIVELFLLLFSLLGLYLSIGTLFNRLIDETKTASNDSLTLYSAIAGVEFILGAAAVAVVSLLLFIVLQRRTKRYEQMAPDVFQSRRRRLLVYIFLSLVGVIVFYSLVALTYTILAQLFAAESSNVDFWRSSVKHLFSVGFGIGLFQLVTKRVEMEG